MCKYYCYYKGYCLVDLFIFINSYCGVLPRVSHTLRSVSMISTFKGFDIQFFSVGETIFCWNMTRKLFLFNFPQFLSYPH